jgi:hypothetical protein
VSGAVGAVEACFLQIKNNFMKPLFRKVNCLRLYVPDLESCAVLEDAWGNPLVLLDISKGLFATDADGNIIGNAEP